MEEFHIIKYKLNNGLRLLIVPAQKQETVWVQICVGVGSCQEKMGTRGIAHLTEHLVIKNLLGRNNRRDQSDNISKSFLGHYDCYTCFDYTLYALKILPRNAYATLKNALSKFLSIERFSQEDLSWAKNTIHREREQKIYQTATGRLYETLYKVAYNRHPYRWYTIGQKRDYSALDLQEVFRFYRSFYIPNNIVVVIIGPLSSSKIIHCVEKGINKIKNGNLPRHNIPSELSQRRRRYHTFWDNVSTEHLLLGFKIPPLEHLYRTGLNVLNYALFGRKAECKRLLTSPKGPVRYVFGYLPMTKFEGLYEILFVLRPGHSSKEVEDILFGIIEKYTAGKVSPDNLKLAKKRAINEFNQIKIIPKIFSSYLGIYELLLRNHLIFLDYENSVKNLSRNSFLLSIASTMRKNHLTAITVKPNQKETTKIVS